MNNTGRGLSLVWFAASTCLSVAAREPDLQIRLLTHLTSYDSAPGSEFRSVVIAPYLVKGQVALPAGTMVYGVVRRMSAVGLGLVRERAGLELEFREYQLPDGRRFPMTARLRRIDNAREEVTEKGQIKGILAAANPQSFVQGVWSVPNAERFQRSFAGLTGASGRIWSEFALGPFGAVGLFALRCAVFRLPEPEMHFPPGAEMRLVVTRLPEDAPTFAITEPSAVAEPLAEALTDRPFAVKRPDGRPANDIINVALIGTRKQVFGAFQAAGWTEAEPKNARSLSRTYKAYTTQAGYASAPTSKLLYEGAVPEMVFQKSLNTIAKRHHIRLWRTTWAGEEIWLGAASHDIGIGFERNSMTFTHMIHPNIDHERGKIATDLSFAGCAGAPGYVDRRSAIRTGGDGSGVTTDGRLEVLVLSDCAVPPDTVREGWPAPPKPWIVRLARRMALEGRQYILRGNLYYWAYRAITWKPNTTAAMALRAGD